MAEPSRQPAGVRRPRVPIALFMVAAFLYWSSLYLYVPTLPTYLQARSENLAIVGVILSQYGFWQAVVRLPLGIAADWLGRRKPFLIGGILLAGLGAWLLGTAGSVQGLFAGRAVTGLAAAAWVLLLVGFSSLFPLEETVRASTLLTLAGSTGRMLATSVTGSLNELGGYSLAFFLAAATAMAGTVVLLPIREARHPSRRPSPGALRCLVTRRDVLLPALLNAVAQYANWGITLGFMPILARQLGASDVAQSLLVSMYIGVVTAGNLFATAVVRRIGAQRLTTLSFVLLGLGIGGAGLAPSLPALFAAQFCLGLSQGAVYPVLMGMSIRHVDESQRATAMGLHQAVYAIGMFGGPALSGPLADAIGVRPMFGVTALACLALGLAMTRRLNDQRPGSK